MIVEKESQLRGERKIDSKINSQSARDEQLVVRARSDPAAFAQLYRRHYDAVFRYCVHRLFERQRAEDVTSAVFLKVVENFRRFQSTRERDFRNWVYTIATNEVNNYLRKMSRRNRLLKGACQLSEHQDSADASNEKLAVLKEAMLSLKPRYQTIITMRFFENLKLTEIAEVLGSSSGTVRSQLSRALVKLREKLDKTTNLPTGGIKK